MANRIGCNPVCNLTTGIMGLLHRVFVVRRELQNAPEAQGQLLGIAYVRAGSCGEDSRRAVRQEKALPAQLLHEKAGSV